MKKFTVEQLQFIEDELVRRRATLRSLAVDLTSERNLRTAQGMQRLLDAIYRATGLNINRFMTEVVLPKHPAVL